MNTEQTGEPVGATLPPPDRPAGSGSRAPPAAWRSSGRCCRRTSRRTLHPVSTLVIEQLISALKQEHTTLIATRNVRRRHGPPMSPPSSPSPRPGEPGRLTEVSLTADPSGSPAERAAPHYISGKAGQPLSPHHLPRGPLADGPGRPAPSVLADRIAATLLEHEAGWRLPRRTDLARRHNVTIVEIDAAISQLADRHLVRQLADGQVYLASPAEYLITLDQLPFLESRIDPMGTPLSCASRHVLRRAVPDEIASALRLKPDEPGCAIQTAWETAGAVAAISTTYLPARLADLLMPHLDWKDNPASGLNPVPASRRAGTLARPAAFCLEIRQPSRWAGRMLRLGACDPAIMVTVRLDDPAVGLPVAVTAAILHPGHFRITVETPDEHLRKYAMACWEEQLPRLIRTGCPSSPAYPSPAAHPGPFPVTRPPPREP